MSIGEEKLKGCRDALISTQHPLWDCVSHPSSSSGNLSDESSSSSLLAKGDSVSTMANINPSVSWVASWNQRRQSASIQSQLEFLQSVSEAQWRELLHLISTGYLSLDPWVDLLIIFGPLPHSQRPIWYRILASFFHPWLAVSQFRCRSVPGSWGRSDSLALSYSFKWRSLPDSRFTSSSPTWSGARVDVAELLFPSLELIFHDVDTKSTRHRSSFTIVSREFAQLRRDPPKDHIALMFRLLVGPQLIIFLLWRRDGCHLMHGCVYLLPYDPSQYGTWLDLRDKRYAALAADLHNHFCPFLAAPFEECDSPPTMTTTTKTKTKTKKTTTTTVTVSSTTSTTITGIGSPKK